MRPQGLSTPSALSRRAGSGSGRKRARLARAASSPRLPSRSEQKRFTGCVMTEECPCSPREATLGASPRRRTAASRGFFHPPAGTEADGDVARRGAAARTRTHLFLRGRVPRERAGASRSRRSFGICSSEKTVRRRRSDARAEPLTAHEKKKRKKNAPCASTTTAPNASRVRRGQDRNES